MKIPETTKITTMRTSKSMKTSTSIRITGVAKAMKTSESIRTTGVAKAMKTSESIRTTGIAKSRKTSKFFRAAGVAKAMKTTGWPRIGALPLFMIMAMVMSLATAWAELATADGAGSLWDERTGFRYTNRKAMQVGDLITIRVSESSTGSNRSTLSASKEASLEAAGGPGTGSLDFLPLFSFDAETKNELDGSGSVSLSGNLTTTLTAVVREIRPNGHLVIEGSRLISLNGEEDRFTLYGVARSEDIRSDNTIQSTLLSEVRIEYDGKGIGKSSSRPGILHRILSWIF